MMDGLEKSIASLYRYVRTVEASFLWENCKLPACEERRSFEIFRRDVMIFPLSFSKVLKALPRSSISW